MSTNVGVNVIEAAPALGAAVEPAPTSLTAVLGIFDRGIPNRPVRIAGPERIADALGTIRADAVSGLALHHYFGNGGQEAIVARIVSSNATPASLSLNDARTPPVTAIRLRAGNQGMADPGLWGRRLAATVSQDPTYTGSLTQDVAAAATSVTLSDVTGLIVGQTLRFVDDNGGSPITQFRNINSINATTGVVDFADGLASALPAASTIVQSTEFRLQLSYRVSANAQLQLVEDWRGLSLHRAAASYVVSRLNDPQSGSRFVICDDRLPQSPTHEQGALTTTTESALTGGTEPAVTAADYVGDPAEQSGLHAFDRSSIQLLTVPDIHALVLPERQAVATAAINYCAARNDCMFIGSLPDRGGAATRPQGPSDYTQSESAYVAAIEAYTEPFRQPKSFAAFYGPFGAVLDPLAIGPANRRLIPLCLPVAGVFSEIARRRGIFKAPAGGGAQLRGVLELSAHFSDAQNTLVVRGAMANLLRRDDVLGLHIDTSRTASTDARWYFVNVRLLFNFIAASLRDGMRSFVHETHNEGLRRRAISAVSSFLDEQRRRGAFASNDAAIAYQVKSDTDNNTASTISRGELHIDVEINPARPAEQINLKVGVTPLGVALVES